MHSFHQSRGRILLEAFCALTIAGSCFGAWTQTGAWALLPAAAVAALYGFVRATDMRSPRTAKAVELQAPSSEQEPVAELEREAAEPAVEAERVEPMAPRAKRSSTKAKAPRKGGARRAGAAVEPKVTEPEQAEQVEAPWPTAFEEAVHSNIEPLFEPEPFVRMPRPAFGRKAG